MATLLNISLLQHTGVIFAFLFVFVVMYAVFLKTKVLGEDKGITSIAALCIAAMTLFMPRIGAMLMAMAPWFAVMFIFLTLVFAMFKFAGAKEEVFEDFFSGEWTAAHWFMMAGAIIILFVAAGNVMGEEFAEATTEPGVNETGEGFGTDVIQIIFHPSVLGMALLLIIASFAIRLLGGAAPKN